MLFPGPTLLCLGATSLLKHTIVRAVVRQGIARGCQTFIIREGWEGLVRGNSAEPTPAASAVASPSLAPTVKRSVSFSALPPSQQLALDVPAGGEKDGKTEYDYGNPDAVAPLSDAPLSFGFGELLKDGAGEGDPEDISGINVADDIQKDEKGRSLKGRYIVRVGWDDVRGWLGEGGTLIGSSRCPSCECTRIPRLSG
jgi:6-phosphofructokinase 1